MTSATETLQSRPQSKDDLKSLPMQELQKKLGSSPDGLSQDKAGKRLAQYAPNAIAENKTNEVLKFLSYLWGPIPWMIELDDKDNARLIVSTIVADALTNLKMAYPQTTPMGRAELKSIRKSLAK